MKTFYRVVIWFTEPKYKDIPPSGLILQDTKGVGSESVLNGAEALFREALREAGIPGAAFRSEIFEVSEEEVEIYKINMKSGSNTHQALN
jgi:hypothetical protein